MDKNIAGKKNLQARASDLIIRVWIRRHRRQIIHGRSTTTQLQLQIKKGRNCKNNQLIRVSKLTTIGFSGGGGGEDVDFDDEEDISALEKGVKCN